MQITVDLGDRSYPIIIEPGCLTSDSYFAELLADRKLCIVTNETIAPLYLNKFTSALPTAPAAVVILPDGERYKTLESIEKIFDEALLKRLNRKSVLIALGGGVIGDMTGFAAACYQRGVDFVQVPTTLLSQVDSSVGGKTGVNHPLGKNMIGSFHQPIAVFIDTDTLNTLPDRELSAGIAEVVKYGLIADEEFYRWLEMNMSALMARSPEALAYAIQRSCELKAEVVAEDEREGGIRAILNLGHTFGHAIEAKMGYGEWLHGEAVAVGMLMAIDLSERIGLLSEPCLASASSLLASAKLPLKAPAEMSVDDFLDAMLIDKKNVTGNIRLVLLEKLGRAVISEDFDGQLMEAVIRDNIA